MSEERPHPLDGKLEPEAREGCDSVSDAALLSIAVSMKRIADKLDGGHGYELEGMFYNAGRAFENGRNATR